MKGNNSHSDIINDKFNELMSADMHNSWREMKDLLDKEMPEKEKKRFGIPFRFWRRSEIWLVAALMLMLIFFFSTRIDKLPNESIRAHERLYHVGSDKNKTGKVKTADNENTVIAPKQTIKESHTEIGR